ncbi:Metallo-dependent phosphatase-like protein [Lasiosphaeria miniovina]|uniref:Metallo-dependent phosphatase-like protein n=1 Tax=Lasiosphaeria miniovina TaxID=1954250 RepID=A0AA40DVV8_9PEZI|nr:Metallo-dependent phosphatase-like protein [Lasiosphaeria miniovina]KAK0717545.1 Metallo-dependent phosphatase-like protein [Lasiosphaeria miniovina]
MATTFLILSDTHDDAFPGPASLPSKVDVVIYCGDLTMIGGLSNYKKFIDVSLDRKWWQDNLIEEEDDPEEPAQALADGRTFTIYASPYAPEFNGYVFAYGPDEDRFGPGAEHPISEGVDIVMTHGSPLLPSQDYVLDVNRQGNHCGCPILYDAIYQARPKLHCFGHIHEGYGV